MALTSKGLLRLLFFLLIYIIFLIIGASIFSAIEEPEEEEKVQSLRKLRRDFLEKYPIVTGKIACESLRKSIKEEIELSQEAARIRYNSPQTNSNSTTTTQLSLNEAKQILNITKLELKEVEEKFKLLFETNKQCNGGSFYLQSKVFRAKQRIDEEIIKNVTKTE